MRARESAVGDAGPVSGDRRGRPGAARAPGDVIAGKYALRRLLGRGGMGSVWHAKNLTLGADVAIKLILPSLVSTEAGERLFREARAAALLEHPGVVRVFDFGWSERQEPFIVMELLRGSTLGELLAARLRLPAELAVQLFLPVAAALSFAHARGIVHRDLKPDNVMLVTTPQGPVTPKIVDFGIAKLLHEDRPFTRAGAIVGSPQYMAPEQASGARDVDARADVWALCVVLYEAIAGFRPFERDGRRAPLAMFVEEPLPPTEIGAGDDALWAILRRGLSVDVGDRWPSMLALGTALAEWALARRIDVDVAGSRIDHLWRTPSRRPTILELPSSAASRGADTTEWAAPAPVPFLPPADTVTAPPPPSLARRWWPLLSLAAVLAALALLRMGWIHKDNSRALQRSQAAALSSPGLLSAPPAPPSADGDPERAPGTARHAAETGGASRSSSPAVAPAETPYSPPPRPRSAGMPLPAQPNF